ncbi:hypothetical protein [Spirillospora sp. NPDC048824]|uniref:hypothetical protein n=1 Tax=Spirillospora sp. NPDC048824 TaxID=3364526 RepID=UPI003722F68C
MISISNLLLRWVSELGGGKVTDLRTRILRTARSRELEVHDGAEGRWIRDVSALGHLDVDWRRGIWSIAPPTLTRLPHSDGLALVTGRRTVADERAVEDAEEDWAIVHQVVNEVAEGDIPVPDSLLVQYDSPDELAEHVAATGFSFTPCAALQMFALLPDLKQGDEAAPPAPGNIHTIQRYDLEERSYQPASSYNQDGLYRWRSSDWSRLVQIRRGTSWLSTDHEYGVYLELARLRRSVMRWRPETETGREQVGALFVDWGAPLPPLHARAAVLCTGLQPRFSALAQTVRYDSVPHAAAERLARSLQQEFEILQPKAATGKVK